MTNDEKLMAQALEALVGWCDQPDDAQTYDACMQRAETAISALRARLAQHETDWDWRHPKAQALIGAKARLEIQLRLIEQLVENPNFDTTASDMEYWEPVHDRLHERLAQKDESSEEPVAWHHPDCKGECIACLIERTVQDAYGTQGLKYLRRALIGKEPPPRTPLTDEQLEELCWTEMDQRLRSFARAIERAHRIGEKK